MAAKRKYYDGFAVVGTHDKPYVTLVSPHKACEGRYQIYDNEKDAHKEGGRVVRCKIKLEL